MSGDVLGSVADAAGLALVTVGVLLALVAALGALRLPDVFSRLHAGAKPQVLGMLLVVAGMALSLRSRESLGMLLLVGLLQLVTAPVTAHMVSRATYRTGKVRSDLLVVDELSHLSGSSAPEGGLPERHQLQADPREDLPPADTHERSR